MGTVKKKYLWVGGFAVKNVMAFFITIYVNYINIMVCLCHDNLFFIQLLAPTVTIESKIMHKNLPV